MEETDGGKEASKRRDGRTSPQCRKRKISLQDYLDFLLSRDTSNLTRNFLNQVLYMHGFRNMHGHPKRVVAEAVDTIDVSRPSRSTLTQSDIAYATVTLEDVIVDLAELEWEECPVTSVEIMGAEKEVSTSLPLPQALPLPQPDTTELRPKPKSKKRKEDQNMSLSAQGSGVGSS